MNTSRLYFQVFPVHATKLVIIFLFEKRLQSLTKVTHMTIYEQTLVSTYHFFTIQCDLIALCRICYIFFYKPSQALNQKILGKRGITSKSAHQIQLGPSPHTSFLSFCQFLTFPFYPILFN